MSDKTKKCVPKCCCKQPCILTELPTSTKITKMSEYAFGYCGRMEWKNTHAENLDVEKSVCSWIKRVDKIGRK